MIHLYSKIYIDSWLFPVLALLVVFLVTALKLGRDTKFELLIKIDQKINKILQKLNK